MNTPYSEIYELFLDRIIKDDTFIVSADTPEESQALTEEKMSKILKQAIHEILSVNTKKNFQVDFRQKDDVAQTFSFELNFTEENLIADYMFYCHVSSDYILRWKALKEDYHFTDDEIKLIIHSPANSLKEFTASVNDLKDKNDEKLKIYLNRNRDTFKYQSVDYNY